MEDDMADNRRLWLIDDGYMFNASECIEPGFQFDYRKIREVVEKDGEIFQAYYLNSTPNPPKDVQDQSNPVTAYQLQRF
jgi:hypothetical protein